MNFSFWEKDSFLNGIDELIIGSGIVGLNTALERKRLHPNHRVVVFDKDSFGGGGSTKNAGFACFGSPTEICSDLLNMSEQDLALLLEARWKGLIDLRAMHGDAALSYKPCGSIELFLADDADSYDQAVNALSKLNRITRDICGAPAYEILNAKDVNQSHGFRSFKGAIANKLEGSIDTGKMMHSLRAKAVRAGIEIYGGANVKSSIQESSDIHLIINGYNIDCKKAFICTNGFAKTLIPALDVHLARNLVLVTNELPDLNWEGTFHMQEGYVYFRNIGRRLLIGGARNLDHQWNDDSPVPAFIREHLESLLREYIVPKSSLTIEHEWTGYLGVGKTRSSIVKQVSTNLYCAVRMGGMGVAIGTQVGKTLALLAEES